ncbi:MAG: ammonium transporter [Deltaproteobacteria bacterium]|nr:ammonium transporter [Deltaproteobacteria bacterium]
MASPIDTGDTAWILTSSALVLLMTPGLAFFYGGMVRKKNVLSTLNLSFIMMGLISLQWVLWGYSLAFGDDLGGGLLGNFKYLFFHGVGAAPLEGSTLPHTVFAIFQMMFAIITPALISGAVVDRIKFSTWIVFGLVWATIVYDPICHWAWGPGGWMGAMGALDFAGGTVVHISAGYSALALAMLLGPRKGFPKAPMEPHNIPFTVLGAGILWFGWFGFNAGSALAANGLSAAAFLNTNTAAAAAAMSWMFMAWKDGKPSVLGIATGAVVGLVAITPASGFVSPVGAIIIGAVASPISYMMFQVRHKWNLDESLDVFACHGIAGTFGALATGFLADPAIAEKAGLFYGNASQAGIQALSVVASAAFAFVVTYILGLILKSTMGLKVASAAEEVGLDLSEHGERAYS